MNPAQEAGRLAGAAVIGGGPAGLMAAEALLSAGVPVDLFDAMPSVGRKFLLAGKGGLNLTHAEDFEPFVRRYGPRAPQMRALLESFGAKQLRDWAEALGVSTFVGSSQRVFPQDMKAAPLLRSWLHRLRAQGLRVHVRHRWLGWAEGGALRFATPAGEKQHHSISTVLALGGASWPQLGSDGQWVAELRRVGAEVADLAPSNCGFDVARWSEHLTSRFAGAPLKNVGLRWTGRQGQTVYRIGECVLTPTGIEGSLVYAASADLRELLAREGAATPHLDLLPGRDLASVQREVAHPRGSRSLASHLQSRLKLTGVKAALLREVAPAQAYAQPAQLAALIKALPITLVRPRPVAEAISTAGGVRFECLTSDLMVCHRPGLFVAGEMLDWEAPTGGYLLTACFSTGRLAGEAAARWCQAQNANSTVLSTS